MKRYERYKPSGIEWIGEIPEHWNCVRLKWVTKLFYGESLKNEDREAGDVPVYGSNGVVGYHSKAITGKPCLIIGRKGSHGKVNYSELPCFPIDTTYYIDQQATENNLRWLFYVLSMLNLDAFSKDSAVPGLSREEAYENILLLPTKEEQHVIASYLDRKTAEIDDLIAKKQRLIDLLHEEKMAIINHAVTKGLDPEVPMKDSSIPCIGQIPAHWKVNKLKFLGNIKYGLGTPPKLKTDGLRLIRATDIQRGEIIDDDLVFVDPEDVPYDRDPLLKTNDIIVVRSGAYTGDSAIIPREYEGSVVGYDMVVRITAAYGLFISYCLLSHYVLNLQIYQHRLRAAQPHLNREELGETLFFIPSDSEQVKIVDFIKAKTIDIKDTTARISREIELLQEYRTALISEVVTGKIDVRGAN